MPWLSSNIRAVALKMSKSLKNEHNFLSLFYKVRQQSELEVQFMLKCDQPGKRGWANLPPKGLQTKLVPGLGR